ncbi:MAG: glycosyltransferase family 39 protein [Patescibacteria group bacterium]
MVQRALSWIRRNRIEFALLVIIVLAGSALRLYQVGGWMHFGQDEGNVARVVRSIATGEDLVALGPAAPNNWSGFHLGPFFYYLLVPFYWMSGLSPAGGAAAAALVTSASIVLVYLVGKKFVNAAAGLSAAALFSASYLMVYYGRWVWHPNVVPFFMLLIFLSLYELAHLERNRKSAWYLYVLAVAVGLVVQLHGTALILVPAMLVVYFIIFRPRIPWQKYAAAAAIIVALNAPMIAYDVTHGFQNVNGFTQILTQSETDNPVSLFERAREAKNVVRDFWFESLTHKQSAVLFYALAAASAAVLLAELAAAVKRKRRHVAGTLMLIWLVLPLCSYVLYQAKIPVHYFCIVFPLPFIFFGWVFGYGWRARSLRIPLFGLLFGLAGLQLYYSVILLRDLSPGGSRASSYPITLSEMESAVEYIHDDSRGEPFVFVSLPVGAYDSGYTYLFERAGLSPAAQEAGLEYAAVVGFSAAPPEWFISSSGITRHSIGNVTIFSVRKGGADD